MNSVAVYTAIFGGYDTLKEHPDIPDADFICFSDDPALCDRRDWDVRLRRRTGLHPRMEAKRPKILGPQEDLADYEFTIWIDGSHVIKTPAFVSEALADLGPDGFALHRHPGRDCIYDEAEVSLRVAVKYDRQPIVQQAEHYRSQGHPEHGGLWACGSMARARSERLDAAMSDWWDEITAWTVQDQISLPPVLRRHGITPAEFPHPQYASPWLDIPAHTGQEVR